MGRSSITRTKCPDVWRRIFFRECKLPRQYHKRRRSGGCVETWGVELLGK